MLLKKNNWVIFYFLLFLGVIYLIISAFSTWQNLLSRSQNEIAFLNKIFSSSVTSTFDQQEIMLELLGHDLLSIETNHFASKSTLKLDKLLDQQQSIIGFGLFNVDGNILAASSNVDQSKMPNLRQSTTSSGTFIRAIDKKEMVLGHTYFLDAINSWVIPVRKSIRDQQGKVLGIMTAGIKPEDLLPRLNDLTLNNKIDIVRSTPYQSILLHDNSFQLAYISGITDSVQLKDIINKPVTTDLIFEHNRIMEQQTGLTMKDIRNQAVSLEYNAADSDGDINMYSLIYIPKYQLWSLTQLPKSYLINQMKNTLGHYLVAFFSVLIIIFVLFRYIHNFEKNNRKQLLLQANHDFLTGLHNRLYLEYAEPKWIYDGARPFSVIFMDLDNFKNINDSYGHSYGDEILIQVADRIRSFFKKR